MKQIKRTAWRWEGAAWRNETRTWRRAMLKTPRPNTVLDQNYRKLLRSFIEQVA